MTFIRLVGLLVGFLALIGCDSIDEPIDPTVTSSIANVAPTATQKPNPTSTTVPAKATQTSVPPTSTSVPPTPTLEPTLVPTAMPTSTPTGPPLNDGIYQLLVEPQPGSSFDGQTVTFMVGADLAAESAVWKQGGTTQLDLTVDGSQGRLPAPSQGKGLVMNPLPRQGGLLSSPLNQVVPPHLFTGTVTLNGSLAPAGTEVSAWVGGVQRAATVVESKPAPQSPSAAASTFGELGDDFTVWLFNNRNQDWKFYSPQSPFSDLSTLTDVNSGEIVWIDANAAQDFQGSSLFSGWNLVVLK